jgi:General secretion pathway protein M.
MAIPLKRVFEEKRRFVIPLLAALALNIGLYALVVYPLGVRVRSMEQREQAAAREMAAAEREDAAARAVLQGRDRTGSALNTFYKDVLPTSLSSARDVTFLRLEELGEQHDIRIKRRTTTTDTDKKGPLARLSITTELEGNYENIRRFIYQLESGSNFVVIDSLQLSQDAAPGSPLALTLGLSTYYRAEPHGA